MDIKPKSLLLEPSVLTTTLLHLDSSKKKHPRKFAIKTYAQKTRISTNWPQKKKKNKEKGRFGERYYSEVCEVFDCFGRVRKLW